MILLGHDKTVADWVAAKTGKPFHPPFTAIGVIDREGTLTAGYVFTGFNGDGVEMSVAGRGVLNRDGWRVVLDYVFNQLNCVRLQMHTSRRNKKVCKTLHRLFPRGFEGIARKFYGKDDGVCFALTTDELSAFRARWKL